MTQVRFAIIGAGRLGSSLALALTAAGAHLLGFVCAHGGEEAAALLGVPPSAGLAGLVAAGPTHCFITVPDSALPSVAAELAQELAAAEWGDDPPVVLHTSGATSVAALAGCEQAGARVLVFHPLQTFSEPVSGARRFPGTAVAVTASAADADGVALQVGFALAEALDARPFHLPDDKRALYHAAATVACNYLVTLQHSARQLFVRAGMPEDEALSLFLPLVRATLENLAAQGPVDALTGPLSRGDHDTIHAHIAALKAEAPHLFPLYGHLGLLTLDLVEARGQVGPAALTELRHQLTQ